MDTTVLIIGAGPVGMTLAHKLTAYGCKVRIIDKNQGPTKLSKALVIWQRTLEVLDSTFDARRLIDHEHAYDVHGVLFQTPTEKLGEVDLKDSEGELPTGIFIPQSATEQVIVEKLKEQGVEIERGNELVSFEQSDDTVVSLIKDQNGETHSITSSWIVGADGAHSQVRHGLKLPFEGNTIERRWLLADISIAEEQNPHFMQAYFSEEGLVGFFPIGQNRWRVIIDGGEAERKGAPSQAEIQTILRTRAGNKWKIEESFWLSEFIINERIVPQYQVGRVFLAGDAAHVHSPAGGQGMNTGMQDAMNLAWKLALAQNAKDHHPLLKTYHEERHLIGERVVAETSQMIHMAMVHHPLVRRLGEFAMRHITRTKWFNQTMKPKVSEIDLSYRRQELAQSAPRTKGRLRAGDRLPDEIENNAYIYRQLKHMGATLLVSGIAETELPKILGANESNLPLKIVAISANGTLAEQLDLKHGGIAMIRPDSYIGAISRNMGELNDWLKKNHLAPST